MDGPLIMNEILTWTKRVKRIIFVLKVDFEKAFDNLRWGFIWDVLAQMNFGPTWIAWMKGIICCVQVSVLVNGSPTKQFKLEKGVRQGDPLLPYLFIIATERLITAISEAKAKGLLTGVDLPNDGPSISSLHYADDAMFIGNWSDSNVQNLMRILSCFHHASGLKLIWFKSSISGVGASSTEITRLASQLGCKEGNLPFRYLGLSTRVSMHKAKSWKTVLDMFAKKLSVWKSKNLSIK